MGRLLPLPPLHPWQLRGAVPPAPLSLAPRTLVFMVEPGIEGSVVILTEEAHERCNGPRKYP